MRLFLNAEPKACNAVVEWQEAHLEGLVIKNHARCLQNDKLQRIGQSRLGDFERRPDVVFDAFGAIDGQSLSAALVGPRSEKPGKPKI